MSSQRNSCCTNSTQKTRYETYEPPNCLIPELLKLLLDLGHVRGLFVPSPDKMVMKQGAGLAWGEEMERLFEDKSW